MTDIKATPHDLSIRTMGWSLTPAERDINNYDLGSPPAYPTLPLASLKEKKKATPWVWKGFTNPARTDNAVFYHWAKKDEPETEYPFAKLNKKIKVFQYTAEEYERYLQDANWTKDQTDKLFELCRDFDLRFVVIHDRFEYEGKTIEDLKQRYYSIANKLLEVRSRKSSESIDISTHPIMQNPYDYNADVARRKALEKLYSRPKEAEEEENLLREKLKKIEAIKNQRAQDAKTDKVKKQKRERDIQQILKTAVMESPPKKSTTSTALRVTVTPPSSGSSAPLAAPADIPYMQPLPASAAATVASSTSTSSSTSHWESISKKLKPGAYARSGLIYSQVTSNTTLAKKLDATLEDLFGVGYRLTPSGNVHAAYDDLKHKVLHLFDLQKKVAKKEAEVQGLRDKRDELARRGGKRHASLSSSSSSNVPLTPGTPTHVDNQALGGMRPPTNASALTTKPSSSYDKDEFIFEEPSSSTTTTTSSLSSVVKKKGPGRKKSASLGAPGELSFSIISSSAASSSSSISEPALPPAATPAPAPRGVGRPPRSEGEQPKKRKYTRKNLTATSTPAVLTFTTTDQQQRQSPSPQNG